MVMHPIFILRSLLFCFVILFSTFAHGIVYENADNTIQDIYQNHLSKVFSFSLRNETDSSKTIGTITLEIQEPVTLNHHVSLIKIVWFNLLINVMFV